MSIEQRPQSVSDTRPCLELIIAAADLAPPDDTDEAMEYGLEEARRLGKFSFTHGCRLEYDQGFYCTDSDTLECVLRKALID